MSFFSKKKQEIRAETGGVPAEDTGVSFGGELLRSLLLNEDITKKEALEIPTVASCIDKIANAVSVLPVKLYKQEGEKTIEITGDARTNLLTKDTKDTLTAPQFWRAVTEDYFLSTGAYAYIYKTGNQVESIHYVENEYVSVNKNPDPVFKDYDILVWGKRYFPFEFLKILRKTKDGCTSKSVVEENNLMLKTAYNALVYENNLVQKGGNKRGFLKTKKKLTQAAIDALKEAFRKLYKNNEENVVVLNDGLEFQETANTSVEMQLNENKETNAKEIAKIFGIPISIIKGGATEEDQKNFIKYAITPFLNDIERSLDRDLLLESEKETHYFAFDTKELTRGSIKERYEAYEIGLRNNFLQVDEVRDKEDLEALGIEWITLGLDQVLYNPKSGEVYTPNTNQTAKMKELGKEKQEDESGIKS